MFSYLDSVLQFNIKMYKNILYIYIEEFREVIINKYKIIIPINFQLQIVLTHANTRMAFRCHRHASFTKFCSEFFAHTRLQYYITTDSTRFIHNRSLCSYEKLISIIGTKITDYLHVIIRNS
uniref:Uncharacterized protein n=1 Tax=Schizaphis graminum TaxID=13262 RepID=A0A2S2N899_SCHGA